jgi:hypothetical protein
MLTMNAANGNSTLRREEWCRCESIHRERIVAVHQSQQDQSRLERHCVQSVNPFTTSGYSNLYVQAKFDCGAYVMYVSCVCVFSVDVMMMIDD